ncbi:DUF4136 domain-containing protein [Sphingomonas donggukensis]|uniref:DUF4136 domain-containing protein n=1 Tax=Sphingomonas donggukensis TaxID=2949093 RepID=A0ABY4TUF7_9SPHN|nr:DUF4136 domain-containing protein [Sphingomonas donggukensis]URW76040.1 DUF4136 domain-containing protein [Sphingomonas donggukensis]
MTMRTAITALALGCAAAGCATTGGVDRAGTDVTRYHLGAPIPAGSVATEPMAMSGAVTSPEYRLYADAVAAELGRMGFAPTGTGTSQYIAAVSFQRTSRGTVRTPPKFSIGIGGGGFSGGRGGGGVGLGGGLSTGFGSKTKDILVSELAVQLRRRSDGTVVWEGRAQRQFLSGDRGSQPVDTAGRLANALFKGFPGESGITISVK